MVNSIDNSKRDSIATQLANLTAMQELLITYGSAILKIHQLKSYEDILRKTVSDDKNSLNVLDSVILKFGVKPEPTDAVRDLALNSVDLIQQDKLGALEYISEYILTKQRQILICGLLQKAAQVADPDIATTLEPLTAVLSENTSHVNQLSGVFNAIGTLHLTGEEPRTGIWEQIKDTVATVSDATANFAASLSSKPNVIDVIKADHVKVNTLLGELESAKDPKRREEFFGQIFKDFAAHSAAEEKVFYPRIQHILGLNELVKDARREHDAVKSELSDIRKLEAGTQAFMNRVTKMKEKIQHHVKEEENFIFPLVEAAFSASQLEKLGDDFCAAKAEVVYDDAERVIKQRSTPPIVYSTPSDIR